MSAWGLILRDRTLGLCALVCGLAVFGFGGWASTAPLAEGVAAFGKVSVDTERVVVQHLEGGQIETIEVAEGDRVEAGDALMVLTNVAARSGRDQIAVRLASVTAGLQRIDALLDNRANLEPDLSGAGDLSDRDRTDIISQQLALFQQQRLLRSSEQAQLASRRDSLLLSVENISREIELSEVALAQVREDLALKRQLLSERMIQRDAVLSLEREENRLLSLIAGLATRRDDATSSAAETTLEMNKAAARFRETISKDRVTLQEESASLSEQLFAARDVVNRSVVIAPKSGTVINLNFTTEGGVVRPGETILELVPDASAFVAILEIRPIDRNAIHEGMMVKSRLSGIDSWRNEPLPGEVLSVSADLKSAPDGRYDYYEARVRISGEGDRAILDLARPGMPVEVFIDSGQSRTMLDYLIEPLAGMMRRGARE